MQKKQAFKISYKHVAKANDRKKNFVNVYKLKLEQYSFGYTDEKKMYVYGDIYNRHYITVDQEVICYEN